MNEPFRQEALSGWGRWDPKECRVYRPERMDSLRAIAAGADAPHLIARGLGRSYGDASVNDTGAVINMTRLNRMIAFDASTGVLECEAGVSFEEILEAFVPRGFFPPVTPGTKFVTVGGAIANDVHGKNHHRDGSFGRFVESLTLLTAAGETVECSLEENADLFRATLGGIGLTGLILRARVCLQPIETAYMLVDYERCAGLEDILEKMAASDGEYQYSVAWVDCLAEGDALGRGVLMRGNHAQKHDLSKRAAAAPLSLKKKAALPVPVDFPGFALNPLSIRAFNTLYNAVNPTRERVLTGYESYFYPLDRLHNWNRMYGKRGFVQYQATFPPSGAAGLTKLFEKLSASKRASFLAVLKSFGPAGDGLLSHPMAGYTLNLDIPNGAGLVPFLHALDALLLEHGGRLYFAKDAVALPETIAAMYPNLPHFREIRAQADPGSRWSSNLARRLGIVDAPADGGEAAS